MFKNNFENNKKYSTHLINKNKKCQDSFPNKTTDIFLEKSVRFSRKMSYLKTGWIYYTNVKPNNENDPLNKAFDMFFNELCLDINELYKELTEEGIKKLVINTDKSRDIIKVQSNYKIFEFSKSKFLMKRKFKQRLIDYYNKYGIFIKGPFECVLEDGTSINKWVIELNLIYQEKKNVE